MEQPIGTTGNFYGGVHVKTENGLYYWAVEDYDGFDWEEIPERLYDELIAFERTRPLQQQ